MEEVKNVVDDKEVVTEEVVEATESEASQPETDGGFSASVEEEAPAEQVEEQPKETQSEDSSLKEDEVPFNKNPKFQERLGEIETKYGKKAQLWDTLAKVSGNDPEFQYEIVRRLELAGELPKGTSDMLKEKLESQKPQEKKKEEPKVSEEISNLPEVQFARELMRKKQEEQAAENQRIEGILQRFEEKHPDIAESEKALSIRKRIAVLADGYKEDGMDYEKALDEAYNVLFNKEALLASAREKGEIEGQIKADIKSVASTPSVSQGQSSSGLRKLTREEEEARILLGMSKEDYIKYKDSDGSVE